jgi:hypothetical protein
MREFGKSRLCQLLFCTHFRNFLCSFVFSALAQLSEEIGFCQIDDFVATSTQYDLGRKGEALHLLKSNCRWHGKFLPTHNGFYQGRSVMLGVGDAIERVAGNTIDLLNSCFRESIYEQVRYFLSPDLIASKETWESRLFFDGVTSFCGHISFGATPCRLRRSA